jgi:general stress protein 26
MWEAMADSPYVMISLDGSDDHSEPMRAQLDKDADGHFWFYTTKTNRIAAGGTAMAQFVGVDHKLFACIAGTLVEETNQQIIDKYWSKPVEAWYEDGKTDDSLKMMRFELSNAEVWLADPSVVGMVKLASGTTLKPDEMGEHEVVEF